MSKTAQKQGGSSSAVKYYRKTRKQITAAIIVVAVFLALFIVVFLSRYGDEFTGANFNYFLKFLYIESDIDPQTGDLINYETNKKNICGIVNDDLLVVSPTRIGVYNLAGERINKANIKYDVPVIESGNKTAIIYDLGGNGITIVNSLSVVRSLTLDTKIISLGSNKAGDYIVATTESGYRSAVYVYSADGNRIYAYKFTNDYTVAVDVNEKTERAVAATTYASGGTTVTKLTVFDLDSTDPRSTVEFKGEFPWRIKYNSDGSYVLLTDKAFRIFDADGNEKGQIEFLAKTVSNYYWDDNYIVVGYDASVLTGKTEMRVFDMNGTEIYSTTYNAVVSDMIVKDGILWVVSPQTLTSVELETGASVTDSISIEYNRLVDAHSECILLFSDSKSQIYCVKEREK